MMEQISEDYHSISQRNIYSSIILPARFAMSLLGLLKQISSVLTRMMTPRQHTIVVVVVLCVPR
jgi:hypothetical protein